MVLYVGIHRSCEWPFDYFMQAKGNKRWNVLFAHHEVRVVISVCGGSFIISQMAYGVLEFQIKKDQDLKELWLSVIATLVFMRHEWQRDLF